MVCSLGSAQKQKRSQGCAATVWTVSSNRLSTQAGQNGKTLVRSGWWVLIGEICSLMLFFLLNLTSSDLRQKRGPSLLVSGSESSFILQ